MRKLTCLALLLCLLAAGGAGLAEGQEPAPPDVARRMMMLPGSVVAGRTVALLAPFGGPLADFTVQKGDIVSARETLFTIETTKVYAPCDGTVGSLGAQVGDDAQFLTDRYSALMYIEPAGRYIIRADTKEAYSADENLLIHIGETVYIGSRNTSERTGVGFVTAVSGKTYTVEVLDSNLIMDDNVAIFRSADFDYRTKVGVGKTEKNTGVPITADGGVFRVHVGQGAAVRRGDLLLEMVSGFMAYNSYPTNQVVSRHAAVVASVDVTPGVSVKQDQLLATLYPASDFQIAVDVLEADLQYIQPGDSVRVEMTNLFDLPAFAGIVSTVSGLSETGSEDPEYRVYIDFEADAFMRPGMNVNVYFNET